MDRDSIATERNGERVLLRLLGIDTPETRGARCAEERRRGLAAKWLLRHLIDAAGVVVIELRGTGVYGRPLALVWWGDLSLADALVGAGLARLYWPREGRKGWC